MRSGERAILSLGIGIVIGASIGILFAPNKGSSTRRKLRGDLDNSLGKVNQRIDDFKRAVDRCSQESKV